MNKTVALIQTEKKIKIMGSIIIVILFTFWNFIASFEPNIFLRMLFFSCGFGSTAYGLTLPLVWLAGFRESQILEEN